MVAALRNAFNIKREEWPRVNVLTLIVLSFTIGVTWGQIVLIALFLEQVGVKYLPFLFIGDALLVVGAFAVYSYFADRYSNRAIMIGLNIIGVLGIAVGLVLVEVAPPAVSYPFLYLFVARAVTEVISNHDGTYIGDFYDSQALKRVFPFLFIVLRVASIIAAVTVPVINRSFSPNVVIALFGLTLAIKGLLVYLMPYLVKDPVKKSTGGIMPVEQKRSFWQNIMEGYQFVKESPFLKAFALMSIMMMLTVAVLNFWAYKVFELKLGSQERITDYLGFITLIGSLFVLPMQLFLFNRLVAKLGVGRMNMVFPSLTAINAAMMIPFPRSLPLSGGTYFNYTILNISIRAMNDELMYNAVPVRVKARTRAFLSGLVEPIGTISGSAVLFLPFINDLNILPIFILAITLGYVGSAWMVTRRYSQALISLLEQENYAFLLNKSGDFVADAATMRFLQTRIAETQDVDTKLFLAKVLTEMGGSAAVPILERLIHSDSPELRAGILNLMTDSNLVKADVSQLFVRCLPDINETVRKAAISGIKQSFGKDHPFYLQLAYQMIQDPSPDVLLEVLPDIVVGNDYNRVSEGIHILQHFLASPDPSLRKIAIEVIREVENSYFHSALAEQLNDPDDQVRLQVIMAVRDIAPRIQPHEPAYATIAYSLPHLLADTASGIQLTALQLIPWFQTPILLRTLTHLLGDSRVRIREEAINVCVEIGSAVVPALEAILEEKNFQKDKAATIALVQILPGRYQDRLQDNLRKNLSQIYTHYAYLDALGALTQYPSIEVLRTTLEEMIEELLDEVFFMLAAIHGEDRIKVIKSSLQSGNQRDFSNAIEALESLITPDLTRLITDLYQEEKDLEKLLKSGERSFSITRYTPDNILRILLNSDTDWIRLITIFILGEISAAQKAEIVKRKSQQRSRKLSMDIFSKLGGGEEKPAETTDDESPLPKAPLSEAEIENLLNGCAEDPDESVQLAVRAAHRLINNQDVIHAAREGEPVLSLVERIYFLKSVLFFQNMSVHQLTRLANTCHEKLFREDEVIYKIGDPGGTLYMVVSGRVGIEREKAKGTSARLSTGEKRFYFGDATLFDNSPFENSAIAVTETLTLSLRHEPMIALLYESPRFSLSLINIMSQRIQAVGQQIAELLPKDPSSRSNIYTKLNDEESETQGA